MSFLFINSIPSNAPITFTASSFDLSSTKPAPLDLPVFLSVNRKISTAVTSCADRSSLMSACHGRLFSSAKRPRRESEAVGGRAASALQQVVAPFVFLVTLGILC